MPQFLFFLLCLISKDNADKTSVKNSNINLLSFGNSFLVRQVILVAFVVGATISIIFTAFNSYAYYQETQAEVVREVSLIAKALQHQLEHAMWEMDEDAVQDILSVFVANSNVAAVTISGSDFLNAEVKSNLKADWSELQFPIMFSHTNSGPKTLGSLKIILSKNKFLVDLRSKVISGLIQNLIRFFIVIGCLVWLFNKKIITPVRKIQSMTNDFNEHHLSPILGESIHQQKKFHVTEIESLHHDIHLLQENFKTAFKLQIQSEEARFQVELQLEKERQKLVLTQRLETIGQITTQIVHDFANLIMIINGKTRILDHNLSDENDLKQTEAIRKTTSRAHSLIKKILSMTRTKDIQSILLDPHQGIVDIMDLLRLAAGSGITLSISSDESEKLIFAESSAFENVLINLCVNSRDAMPLGGEIKIDLKSINLNNQDVVAISVSDNGPGIPLEIQAQIFEPFFTTKDVGKGTGLGLAQVQKFVSNMGGSIDLKSDQHGTCFTLYLPNKRQQLTALAA